MDREIIFSIIRYPVLIVYCIGNCINMYRVIGNCVVIYLEHDQGLNNVEAELHFFIQKLLKNFSGDGRKFSMKKLPKITKN